MNWPAGWRVEHVDSTGSTNLDLIERADRGELVDRTVLVAGTQVAGRGRRDRSWKSPPVPDTNLFASYGFTEVPDDPGELMRRCSLAYVAAARSFGVDAALKWPNDLVVDDAKLAGVLAQRAASGAVVVGVGLNVGWAPDGAAKIGDVPTHEVLQRVLEAFDELPDDLFERYRAATSTIGRRVRVELTASVLEGTADDVAPDGRLIVIDDSGEPRVIDVGDVVHLRPER